MKCLQQGTTFSPIAVVLETHDEVAAFWDMLGLATGNGSSPETHRLAVQILNYLSNEAKL